MGKRKEEKKHKKEKGDNFFIIEGEKLNEKTGKMEPYKKKVYWNSHGC